MTDMIAAELAWNNAVVFGTKLTEGMLPGLTDFALEGAGAAIVMEGIYNDAKMMPEAYSKAVQAAAALRLEMDALGASAGVGFMADLFGGTTGTGTTGLTSIATGALTAEQAIKRLAKAVGDYTTTTVELTKQQQAMATAGVSGFKSVAEAAGAALVSGEGGWKAFGRAGLNAIAGVIDAMAIEADMILAETATKIALGQVWLTPGLGSAVVTSALIHGGAGAVRAIPMAEGGSGVTTGPTNFFVEKAGEPFEFGGTNNKRGMGRGITQNFYIGGSVIAERQVKQLAMAGLSQAARGY
jgi:hypothetical protein